MDPSELIWYVGNCFSDPCSESSRLNPRLLVRTSYRLYTYDTSSVVHGVLNALHIQIREARNQEISDDNECCYSLLKTFLFLFI